MSWCEWCDYNNINHFPDIFSLSIFSSVVQYLYKRYPPVAIPPTAKAGPPIAIAPPIAVAYKVENKLPATTLPIPA